VDINSVMALSPYLEVAVRHTYWHTEPLVEYVQRRRASTRKSAATTAPKTSMRRVADNLARRGIGRGDILIVHSAYRPLSVDTSPALAIAILRELIGPEGTLVMPGIPVHEGEPTGTARLTADVSELVLDYDPATTPMWTGLLPQTLHKVPGAKRSLHPLNSVIALGPRAEAMLAENISGERPMPCGPQSSWNWCRLHGAKIVALGVDMAHSLTMIHVAEDVAGDRWPVPNWWRDRRFRVKTARDWTELVVRERHPKWALHYAERTLSKDLERERLLTWEAVEGVSVGVIESAELLRYLESRNANAYPYYVVPRK